MVLLRLPAEVLPVFRERIAEALPERAKKIESAILDVRGGRMNESAFGRRMSGAGPRWEAVERMFDIQCARLGLNRRERPVPQKPHQRELF